MKTLIQKIGVLLAMLLTFLSASAYDFEVNGIYYSVVSLQDLSCEVVSGDEQYTGDVVIPAEVTEVTYNNRALSVTSIGERAFLSCSSLTSIEIPNSVTSIGERAFGWCSLLTSIEIPNSVTSIGERAFMYCTSLTSIEIPNSVTSIEVYAFSDCSSLTSIKIPNSVTSIGEEAFSWCSSLTSIEIPNSVTSIGRSAFQDCSSLTSIEIPNSVTSIGERAFMYCSSLTSIEIPNSVTEIGSEAFYYCISLNTLILEYSDKELSIDCSRWINESCLEYVTLDRAMCCDMSLPNLKGLVLGKHLEKVQVKELYNCDKLEAIECRSLTPPSVEEFSNAQYMNIRVSVPDEALEAYKQHPVWGKFWNLANENNISVNPSENKETGRYDLYGRSVSEDYQGMVIIRYSDGSTRKVFVK